MIKPTIRSKFAAPSAWSTLLLVLAILLISSNRVHTQTPPPPRAGPSQPLLTRVVYEQLFKYILFLDQQADLAEQHGKDGGPLRNHYQKRGKLNAAEAGALKQIAHKADADIKAVDEEIKSEILIYRALLPNKPTSKSAMPAVPQVLKTLQDKKDSITLAQAAAIESLIGTTRFQQFDAFVRSELTPHITVGVAVPPRAANSAKRAPAPQGH